MHARAKSSRSDSEDLNNDEVIFTDRRRKFRRIKKSPTPPPPHTHIFTLSSPTGKLQRGQREAPAKRGYGPIVKCRRYPGCFGYIHRNTILQGEPLICQVERVAEHIVAEARSANASIRGHESPLQVGFGGSECRLSA